MTEAINQNNVAEICKSFAASMKSIKGIDEKDIKKSMHTFKSSVDYIIDFYKVSSKLSDAIKKSNNDLIAEVVSAQKTATLASQQVINSQQANELTTQQVISSQYSTIDSIGKIVATVKNINDLKLPDTKDIRKNIIKFKREVNMLMNLFVGKGGVIEQLNEFTELSSDRLVEIYDEDGKLLNRKKIEKIDFKKIFDSFKEIFDSVTEMIEDTSKLNKSSIKAGLLISKTRSELFGNGKNRKGIFDLYIDIINSPQLKVLRYKKTSDQISGMNDTVESINDLISSISESFNIKDYPRLLIYNRQILPLFQESLYRLSVITRDEKGNPYVFDSAAIKSAGLSISLVSNIIESAGNTNIKQLKRYNETVLPLVQNIIWQAVKLTKNRAGKSYNLDNTALKAINTYIGNLNKLIESISEIGIGDLVRVAIAAKFIEKLVEHVKTIIFTLDKFANEMKGKKFASINESTKKINAIINNFLSIVGGIIVLALASVPLLLAVPFALGAVLLIGVFIKTVIGILDRVINKEVIEDITLSTIRLTIIITAILFMVGAVIGMLVLVALALPVLIKSSIGTLLTFAIITLVLFAIIGLAQLINKIFSAGVDKTVYQGLLLMIALIGVMLITAGMVLLLGLAGAVFFKDNFWLLQGSDI